MTVGKLDRRSFLELSTLIALNTVSGAIPWRLAEASPTQSAPRLEQQSSVESDVITLFLCGDVMTGRGIDQVLPHPGGPEIYESYMRSARGYVKLAERANGPIQTPVDFAYIWGDALAELERVAPDVRIINLETGVTKSDDFWPGKGIHYRMHPDNVPCLTAAGIDCCTLANNHVLDWGYEGLLETIETLHGAGIQTAGAGRTEAEAAAPAIVEVPAKGRVLVFALGSTTSGIPREWAAGPRRPGVNLIDDPSGKSVAQMVDQIDALRRDGDIVVISIHWGENWGYRIPAWQRAFSHRLVDETGADIVHGHSSHHPKGIEIYNDKPIFYGCGDFINDYEGIGGREKYRADLALMYFPRIDSSTGHLVELTLTPMRVRNFRLNHPSTDDAVWLEDVLAREGRGLGTRVELQADGRLLVHWDS